MRGGLWLIRLLLLVAVSAVVFSPLVVHGEASAPRTLDLEGNVSNLALPSSPTYPVVTAYREVRLALSESRCEKARVSLSFASDDAVAIMKLAMREDYSAAVQHAATYRQDFDRSVGWTVVEGQDGTNVAALLAELKNEHMRQQAALARACALVPPWAVDGLDTARRHAAAVLLEAIEVLETDEQAESYRATLAQVFPEIVPAPHAAADTGGTTGTQQPVATGTAGDEQASGAGSTAGDNGADVQQVSSAGAPDIASMSVRPSRIPPGGTCSISCNVVSGSTDQLQYTWSCPGGELDPRGSRADWIAPDIEGTYEISVVVTDSQGNSDTASIQVRVRDSQDDSDEDAGITPLPANAEPDRSASADILGVDVTADHKYLEKSLAGYAILVSRSCTITCVVEDPDAVSFSWTANAGTLAGDGDTVTWKAPQSVGNFKVTVVVANADGQQDTAVINFHCTTCSQCF